MMVAAIWILAIVAAYPYIPGSGSGVFQGVSVLIGAMVTLGSSGIANQIMSGLTLVYSRALRRGDHVFIGAAGSELEGVVTEVGTLATKIMTMRNEEITVPNAVVVSNPIRNFSKLAEGEGTLISTRVTIGYDAPWRQVHAMLEEAARRTPGLRGKQAPRVAQRGLSDFYVEYELFANIDRPLDKVHTLSRLHAGIQDVFNEYGVQIMSPHFLGQPAEPVLVRKDNWHAAPAPQSQKSQGS
jgi:small-conductance mechanosensitive channel